MYHTFTLSLFLSLFVPDCKSVCPMPLHDLQFPLPTFSAVVCQVFPIPHSVCPFQLLPGTTVTDSIPLVSKLHPDPQTRLFPFWLAHLHSMLGMNFLPQLHPNSNRHFQLLAASIPPFFNTGGPDFRFGKLPPSFPHSLAFAFLRLFLGKRLRKGLLVEACKW